MSAVLDRIRRLARLKPQRLLLAEAGDERVVRAADDLRRERLAEVVVTEPTGSEVQVLARHGADDVVAVFRERFMPEPGRQIRLAPDLAHAHVFDAGTGGGLRA